MILVSQWKEYYKIIKYLIYDWNTKMRTEDLKCLWGEPFSAVVEFIHLQNFAFICGRSYYIYNMNPKEGWYYMYESKRYKNWNIRYPTRNSQIVKFDRNHQRRHWFAHDKNLNINEENLSLSTSKCQIYNYAPFINFFGLSNRRAFLLWLS